MRRSSRFAVRSAASLIAVLVCAMTLPAQASADSSDGGYPYDSPDWPSLAATWGNAPDHADSFTSSTWPNGDVLHWSTCDRPITWWTDSTGGQGSGTDSAQVRAVITAALQEASAVTGYTFVDGGSLDGTMGSSTAGNSPGNRSGITFVLGSGTDATTAPEPYRFALLDGNVLGLTHDVGGPNGLVQNSQVWLDVHQIGADAAKLRGVITHEVGHVLGIDHVADPSQLMYPNFNYVTDFMAGDRHGLAIASTQPCRFTAPVRSITWKGLSPTGYKITWTPASDFSGTARGYVVQARANGKGWRTISRVAGGATSFMWRKAKPATRYQFRVAGFGKGGRGPWSGVA